jgi:uncharacterized membrane protein SpoIIM required for sporulation
MDGHSGRRPLGLTWRLLASLLIVVVSAGLPWLYAAASGPPIQRVARLTLTFARPSAFAGILRHNLLILIAEALGALTFGVMTMVVLASVSYGTSRIVLDATSRGMPPSIAILSLLPHGVFEIVAYLSGGVVGLSAWIAFPHLTLDRIALKRTIVENAAHMTLSIFLLVVAAYIETHWTARIFMTVVPKTVSGRLAR